jgi:hypothetical protein
MDLQRQCEVSFRGNASPAVATTFPTPQYPQSSPSSNRRPDQNQLRSYTGVMRDDRVSHWNRDTLLFARAHTHVPLLVPTGTSERSW